MAPWPSPLLVSESNRTDRFRQQAWDTGLIGLFPVRQEAIEMPYDPEFQLAELLSLSWPERRARLVAQHQGSSAWAAISASDPVRADRLLGEMKSAVDEAGLCRVMESAYPALAV